MTKEKQEIFFRVSVKRASDGSLHDLEAYVPVELDWQKDKATFIKTEYIFFPEYYPKGDVIDFKYPPGGKFNFRFWIKKLELEKGWFKDKVKKLELEPVQDEISEKIVIAWGSRAFPSQYKWGNIILTVIIAIFLAGGIIGLFLFLKKKFKM